MFIVAKRDEVGNESGKNQISYSASTNTELQFIMILGGLRLRMNDNQGSGIKSVCMQHEFV